MKEENSVTEKTAKAGEVTNAQDTLDALGVCVTSENEDGGITVYSESSGKKSTIRNPGQLKIEKLIQLCGEKALDVVEVVGLPTIRGAFAQAAHRAKRFSDDSVRRQGIWETEAGSIGIVADGAFCKWNGTKLIGPASPLEGPAAGFVRALPDRAVFTEGDALEEEEPSDDSTADSRGRGQSAAF